MLILHIYKNIYIKNITLNGIFWIILIVNSKFGSNIIIISIDRMKNGRESNSFSRFKTRQKSRDND